MTKLVYRVGTEGNTGHGAGLVAKEFGVDPRKFGHFTPGEVAVLSKLAKDTKFQAKLAKQALAALAEIAKYKEEIERYRKEAIELGLKTKEQIDQHILAAILATHKHDAHIKEIMQKTMHGMGLIDAQSQSHMQLADNSFQNKLRVLQAKHRSALGGQAEDHQVTLGEISAADRRRRGEAKRERRFMEFIRADNYKPRGSNAGGGLLAGWFS